MTINMTYMTYSFQIGQTCCGFSSYFMYPDLINVIYAAN